MRNEGKNGLRNTEKQNYENVLRMERKNNKPVSFIFSKVVVW